MENLPPTARPGDANPRDPTPYAADVALARRVLELEVTTIREFEERMECVPRILSARNARMGHPVPPEELADLVQDTLVLIWRKLPEFEGRSSLETWIYRIFSLELMNAVRSWRRAHRRLAGDPERLLADQCSREQDPSSSLRYQDLYQGLARLAPEEERVLRLKHYEDLTFDEIGRREGMSTSRAKARYYAAMQRLRHYLRSERIDKVGHG